MFAILDAIDESIEALMDIAIDLVMDNTTYNEQESISYVLHTLNDMLSELE